MSNHSPTLQEFACPIPLCHSEADFAEILNIFQHLNCKILAISDCLGGWGVVKAEDMLSVVAGTWLGNRVALSGQSQNARDRKSPFCRLTPDVGTLVRSVTLYQVDLRLSEFLNGIQSDRLFQDEEVCLLVDRQGELQGQLDRHKIIKYLASNSSPEANKNSELPNLSYLANLVDAFSLPCKIETAKQHMVHANQKWHILEQENSQVQSPKASSSTDDTNIGQMTKRWIESQKSILQPSQSENLHYSSSQDFDLLWQSTLGVDSIYPDNRSLLEVEIESGSDWNYLKIPLINNRQKTGLESYSLVLATPIIQTDQLAIESIPSTAEKSTAQILNAVSHELKSPLTGIVGLSSLLKEQKLGILNQRQVRYVELIHRSGKKMMRIIDDLVQLNLLMAEKSWETESIDLEFLCRQLYQTISIKVEPVDIDSNLTFATTQPKLRIESGSEIAIANKLLLSSVLSHLILEAINNLQDSEQLEIQISRRLGGMTSIAISSQGTASITSAGFSLTIAEHLAAVMGATVSNDTTADRCQLTLLLPKNKVQSLLDPEPHTPACQSKKASNLTILCLYPELEVIDPLANLNHESNFDLQSCDNNCGLSAGYQHRIIEADSIEQAHNLARIWQLDAIILNGYQIARPDLYLRSLQEYEHLASLPLITLDTKTTEAANQIEGLNVFPCLLPSQCRSIEDLIQVIQIAIES